MVAAEEPEVFTSDPPGLAVGHTQFPTIGIAHNNFALQNGFLII